MTRRSPSRPLRGGVSRTVGAATALLLAAALTGCAPSSEPARTTSPPAPAPTSAPPAATPSETPPAAPSLVPDGTAADNLPFFSGIVAAVAGGPDAGSGRAYVDALIAGGFDRAAMQVTQDASTVGNPAESIQFAVRWGEECLVGQVGPATGAPVATVLPVLPTGTCLLGNTRPIDW